MNWLRFFKRRRRDHDLDRELAAHLEAERAENLARGMTPEEADRQARIKVGSGRRVHEDLWQQNSFAGIEGILRDLRYAARSLARAPAFTLTVVLVIALGIGANTAVFSVMNLVLLKSLPVAASQRVVYLTTDHAPDGSVVSGNSETSFSWHVYQALRQQHAQFSDVMAYVPLTFGGKTAVRYADDPQEAEGDMVSGNFFSGLGVRMALGRGFNSDDERRHAPLVVLSYYYWTRRFSGSRDVLGKTLFVKGVPLTIVGIGAPGFEGTEPGDSVDFWIPLQSRPELNAWGSPALDGKTYLVRQDWWCLRLIARLAPGVMPQQAVAGAQTVYAHAALIGIRNPRRGDPQPRLGTRPARGIPGYDEYYGTPLKAMMMMVALILLMAIGNVTMLFLARNENRQREFSLRLSLGAGRGHLLRQLLVESFLLIACSGVLAWLFALFGTRTLATWATIDASLQPDLTALALTFALLLLAALVLGLAPLRLVLAAGPQHMVKGGGPSSGAASSRFRGSRMVIALQMSFCLALLVGAGLLVRTLRNLDHVSLGMRTQGLVVFGINPQAATTPAARFTFYSELLAHLRALPGVEAASLVGIRPGTDGSNNSAGAMIDGHKPPNPDGSQGMIRENAIGPDYFHTMGVPILAGRDFFDDDTARAPKVAIVNRTFAERFLPGESAVGHTLTFWGITAHIVGVVKDHKYTSITEDPIPMLWFPYTQGGDVGQLHVEMRVQGDPLAILPAAQNAVRQIDPNLPLLKPELQQAQFEASIAQQILFARLAECFGLLAVVLVATGIYGTLAYRVSRRTAEIGVRMALGAQRSQVVWMVLRSSLWLTLIGVAAGIPLAALISRALASALYQVKPFDLPSYLAAILGLAFVALIASAIPAQRAARLDPVKTLRAE